MVKWFGKLTRTSSPPNPFRTVFYRNYPKRYRGARKKFSFRQYLAYVLLSFLPRFGDLFSIRIVFSDLTVPGRSDPDDLLHLWSPVRKATSATRATDRRRCSPPRTDDPIRQKVENFAIELCPISVVAYASSMSVKQHKRL